VNVLNKLKNKKFILVSTLITSIIIICLLTYVAFNRNKCESGNCDNGFGSMQLKDGSFYAGGFYRSKFHDFGILQLVNGDRYEGYWHRGERHGKGSYYSKDGSIFVGSYRRGMKHGMGTFTWPDGTMLQAEFKNGEPEGKTEVTLPNKVLLKGIYREGVIYDGEGINIYEDGTRYIGQWANGQRNGRGVLFAETGEILKQGKWFNDKFIE
jgi:hypothetical protein